MDFGIDIAAWLNLAVRWLHLITGIAWIGSSFYFVWLDNHLREPVAKKKGMSGELWSVHGGGFYHKQKYAVAPEEMPEELHWFKWEAYATWMSGFGLLVIIYYWGADLFLIDSAKVALAAPAAIGIGIASIAGGWIIYDGLCRSPIGQNNKVLGVVWFALLVAASYGLAQIFSDRAAYIHIGAIVGTAMAANVFMVIIPNQKKVVAALTAGQTPDPRLGQIGKQRSLHNNYMTLPVLFIMISNHYPMTFGHPYGWAVLAAIGALGVMIRHFFNLKHRGQTSPALVAASVALFLLIAMVSADTQYAGRTQIAAGTTVSFTEAQAIVSAHCTSCHAEVPTHESFAEAPGGVMLDTPARIRQYAAQIEAQAVLANIMPLGNETGMTDEERARLGAWIAAGAKTGR